MLVEFEDDDLRRLYEEQDFRLAGLGPELVRAFRKVLGLVVAAADERDLRSIKSLHFEKLQARRADQYSMRLYRQWRLVVRLEDRREGRTVVVVEVVDYH
ncbi:MAG: type II toxin-antitoxin system RelE/ParE family toxin [Acidimicrobiales bacterium]